MPKKRQSDRLTPLDVAPHAAQWSQEELENMAAIIAGLLEASEPEHKQETPSPSRRGRRGGAGYFEEKTINGCGPYRYLRYWRDGSRKSVYIGKALYGI